MCVVERGCFDVSLSPDRLSTIVSSEIDPIHHHHLFFGNGWGGREIPTLLSKCQYDDDYHDLYHRDISCCCWKKTGATRP